MKLIKSLKQFQPGFSYIHLASFLLWIVLLSRCRKEEESTPTAHDYLVSYEKINNYSASFVKIVLSSMVAQYPGIDSLSGDVKYSIDLFKVTYRSKFKDSGIIASGLVCVPATEGNFPILSFQNGTNTFKLNAPSINPADPLYTLLEMMASHGFVVVIADYPGFGASSSLLHLYYDRASSDAAVINLIKATHELLQEETVVAGSNNKHYLMGYSQGGWATLSALGEIDDNHSDSIKVVATSCGAGAYDLTAMSGYVLQQEIFPGPIYLPYFIHSRIENGLLSEPLTDYFNEPYASRIPNLFNGSYTNTQVNEQLNDTIVRLLTEDLIQNLNTGNTYAPLRNELASNSLSAWNTTSLLRFYHGNEDLNVPFSQSELIFHQFESLPLSNSQLEFIEMDKMDHSTALIPWGINSILWFDSLNQ
jgi:hypothetical protein